MNDIVNRPRKSRWIGGMYAGITIAIAIINLIIYISIPEASAQQFASIIMLAVLVLMVFITASFYNTKYKIVDGVLRSWSPFMSIKIRLKDIRSVEKTLVPLHFRVGASLYSGSFYVPGLGWVESIITNLTDAVMITTRNGKRYMITPSNPKRFMSLLK